MRFIHIPVFFVIEMGLFENHGALMCCVNGVRFGDEWRIKQNRIGRVEGKLRKKGVSSVRRKRGAMRAETEESEEQNDK